MINRRAAYTTQLVDFRGRQIVREIAYNYSELSVRNVWTPEISGFSLHNITLAYPEDAKVIQTPKLTACFSYNIEPVGFSRKICPQMNANGSRTVDTEEKTTNHANRCEKIPPFGSGWKLREDSRER